ncbi:MAG: CPBP family intramembrane glutamic endopeptidase [Polyangiales bacterium]
MHTPGTTADPTRTFEGVPVAPRWHTGALVALYLSVALAGALLERRGVALRAASASVGRVMAQYLPLVVVQWSLALYVARVGRPRSALFALLGTPWRSLSRALADLALAALAWAFITGVELASSRLFASVTPPWVVSVLPHSATERLMWAVVSVSAGFCEELVFRGYLQTQLAAFTGRAWLAVLLQSALFAIAHGEQGEAAMARAALYGVLFGALARWRRSLAPGIVAHVWTDLASGLLRV